MRPLPLLGSLAALACLLASAQSPTRTPVGTTESLTGKRPIYALCTSPKAGQRGLAGAVTIPRNVEPACGQKHVKAHAEWAWAGPPSTVAVHAYWVRDDRPLRDLERQLRAGGWKLDARFPSPQGEQVRYVKPGQEVTLQDDNPFEFFLPDYRRKGRLLQLRLLSHGGS